LITRQSRPNRDTVTASFVEAADADDLTEKVEGAEASGEREVQPPFERVPVEDEGKPGGRAPKIWRVRA